jgi:SnoaL-like domain
MVLDSLRADDRAQLHELYARSVVFLELGRCKQWVELFDPRAVVRCVHDDGGHFVAHQFKGRDELLRLAERILRGQFDIATGELIQRSRIRHFLGSICLSEEGPGHASGMAQVAVMSIEAGRPRWMASGSYADHLVKGGSGCWRFQSRTFTADGVPAAQLRQKPIPGLARQAVHS